jgi:hypothetical protein
LGLAIFWAILKAPKAYYSITFFGRNNNPNIRYQRFIGKFEIGPSFFAALGPFAPEGALCA